MSPKGVEHDFDIAITFGSKKCIHQCRRKALSTRADTLAYPIDQVHSSMSPKGVEHAEDALVTEMRQPSAFINVAERR